MEADDEYLASVEAWIAREAPRCSGFGELVTRLPGVYPKTAAVSLERLVATGRIAEACWSSPGQQASRRVSQRESVDLNLPAPHPLDYDWRFSPAARKEVLARCLAATSEQDLVVLIGTPTILAEAQRSQFAREVVLLDRNPRLSEFFENRGSRHRMIRCDVATDILPVLARPARTAVLDPPWYDDHMRSFLWAAAELTAPGGSILMSIPPLGTRPGILRERRSLFACAERMGLEVASVEDAVLAYLSPPFEQSALEVDGLNDVPNDWRRGDLVTFVRGARPDTPRPPPPDTEGAWVEERLRGTRLRIRESTEEPWDAPPRLVSLAENDVLTTVSRRDARRRMVDVWTLGNRVFAAEGRAAIRHLVRALNEQRDPEDDARVRLGRGLSRAELDAIRATIEQLRRVAELEHYEAFV